MATELDELPPQVASDFPEKGCVRKSSLNVGWVGILFGGLAAILYTLANSFLRELSMQIDPVLVAATKAACTAVVVWPIGLFFHYRGMALLPPLKGLLWMLFAAIQVQLLGGVMLQIALGILGMAMTVPIYMGAMVVSTAVLGRIVLNEPLTKMLSLSLLILIVSVFVLCLGAEDAHAKVNENPSLVVGGSSFVVGVLAAISTGLSYAVLGVTIRGVFRRYSVPEYAPILVVASVGTVMLGGWSLLTRGGWETLCTADTSYLLAMVMAGVANAFGFLCLAKSLKLLPAVYVNSINVSQVAIAAVVGVLWFQELLSASLLIGLSIMLLGFWLLANSSKRSSGHR